MSYSDVITQSWNAAFNDFYSGRLSDSDYYYEEEDAQAEFGKWSASHICRYSYFVNVDI